MALRRHGGAGLYSLPRPGRQDEALLQGGSLTSALVRFIMEEEKPNQVEQFKIPRKSIARFFRPSATKDEIEGRIVRALELLEQAEARRGRQGGA